MQAVMSDRKPPQKPVNDNVVADYQQQEEDQQITFDYLLQKVVENTMGMTTKTTQDGTTDSEELHKE